MTGKDLLDAIGYVDEELLEHCQKTEQKAEKTKIFWIWRNKKFVPIHACVCLLILLILGFTYRQHHFSGADDTLPDENAKKMEVSLETDSSGKTKRPPGTEEDSKTNRAGNIPKGTDDSPKEEGLDETDQNAKEDSSFALPDADKQSNSGILPDTDHAPGTEGGTDPATEDPGNPQMPTSADKIDDISPGYSRGIDIESVKKIPQENINKNDPEHPDDILNPQNIPSAKKILAENTVIIRGTVKKIQHYHATGGKINVYFSVVAIKVKEVYRGDKKGNPQKNTICKIYLPHSKNSTQSWKRMLSQLTEGNEAIIMPHIADAKTGIRKKENFFAFLDVADYYMDAKTAESHIFLKKKSGVLYDTRIYNIPYTGKKITLDDVADYLKNQIK